MFAIESIEISIEKLYYNYDIIIQLKSSVLLVKNSEEFGYKTCDLMAPAGISLHLAKKNHKLYKTS